MTMNKLKNFFDVANFAALAQSQHRFADSANGIVLARHLTAVDPNIFTVQYPDLAFVNAGIRVDNTGGAARVIQSLRVKDQGQFKVAGNAASDKGKISISSEESEIAVFTKEAEAKWSDTDIKQAELAGINLVQRFVEATNRIYMYEVDETGFLGVETNKGILNTAAFTATGAGGAIGTLTGKQMYDAISDIIANQHSAVKNTAAYMATHLAIPTHVWAAIVKTDYDTSASTPVTVLTRLRTNYPQINFFQTQHADNAGGTGVSHTVAFSNNSQGVVMRIPQPLRYGEIVKNKSFYYEQGFEYSIAGVDILEPSIGRILTGL
jgi:hypothetical protein